MAFQPTRFLVLDQPLPGQEKQLTENKPPVRIYRAQKAPEWMVEDQEDGEETFVDQLKPGADTTLTAYERRVRKAREIAEPEIVYDPSGDAPAEDAAGQSPEPEEPEVHEEFDLSKLADLEVPEVEPVAGAEDEDENGEDEELLRERLKEKARIKAQEKEENPEGQQEDEAATSEEDSDDSSEFESGDELPTRPRRMKPMFLTKKERKKLHTRSRPDEIKNKMEKYEKQCKKDQKEAARKNLYAIVRFEDQKKNKNDSDEELPDTDDDADEEEQFEAWKLRELKRIKREKDALDKIEEEKITLERRRKMTDKEIEMDNEAHGVSKHKEQKKMKFMQKYYHKGAFFQDDTLVDKKIMARDYLAPTREDKWIDFEQVPDVMRVKNFGLASQTKWTHLVQEDTTNATHSPWASVPGQEGKMEAARDDDYDVMREVLNSRRFQRNRWSQNQSLSRPSKYGRGGPGGYSRSSKRHSDSRSRGGGRSPDVASSSKRYRNDPYPEPHEPTPTPSYAGHQTTGHNQYSQYPPPMGHSSNPPNQPPPPPS